MFNPLFLTRPDRKFLIANAQMKNCGIIYCNEGFLPDVWLLTGRDHAAVLHVSVPGGAGHYEERPGTAGTGPARVRGAQGGDPVLL